MKSCRTHKDRSPALLPVNSSPPGLLTFNFCGIYAFYAAAPAGYKTSENEVRGVFIRSLLIENFRAIQHLEISFDRRITVMVGENGCGKSSVLNALEAVLGRNVPKDSFDIKASDFYRHIPSSDDMEPVAAEGDSQTSKMRLMIEFGGSYADGCGVSDQTPLEGSSGGDSHNAMAEKDHVLRADEAAAEALRREKAEAVPSESFRADAAEGTDGGEDKEDSCFSLKRFRTRDFMIDLPLKDGRVIKVLSFYLCVDAERGDDDTVSFEFWFEDDRHRRIKLDEPLEYLKTLKNVSPFLRIRPGVLNHPARGAQYQSGSSIDSLFSQAFSELTGAEYSAEKFIESNRDVLYSRLSYLERFFASGSSAAAAAIDSEIDDASEEEDSAAGSHSMDRYTKTLSERSKKGLAIIEEHLLAPRSIVSASLMDSGEFEISDSWPGYTNKFNNLLRSTAARELTMLVFADAFFRTQAEDRGSGTKGSYFPILSVEEPEAHLHPIMLTSVWNLIDSMFPQRILSTNSSDLLTAVPLTGMRRMVRTPDGIGTVYRVHRSHIHINDLRRIAYHLRIRRGTAMFMRFWILVEGETECWILPEVARAMGYDLWEEGVELVEFAQCGLTPLAKLANEMGICWHLLADGDKAGRTYGKLAHPLADKALGRVTVLNQADIENCFWENGYSDVFKAIAGPAPNQGGGGHKAEKAKDTIKRAIRVASKPGLALALGRAMQSRGIENVPKQLYDLILDAVRTARHPSWSRRGETSAFNSGNSGNIEG